MINHLTICDDKNMFKNTLTGKLQHIILDCGKFFKSFISTLKSKSVKYLMQFGIILFQPYMVVHLTTYGCTHDHIWLYTIPVVSL